MWSRHKFLTKQERLLRFEKTTCERQIDLNPAGAHEYERVVGVWLETEWDRLSMTTAA